MIMRSRAATASGAPGGWTRQLGWNVWALASLLLAATPLLAPATALAADAGPTASLAPVQVAGIMALDSASASAMELALIDQVNADRAADGLPPVTYDPELLQVARSRAAAQVPLSGLSHYDDSGKLAFTGLLAGAGASYRLAGENLARLSASDATAAAAAERALMNSPTHYANIMEPTFDRLAVGAARDASGRII